MDDQSVFNGAPEWARFYARDNDGWGYWYEDRPVAPDGRDYWLRITGRWQRAHPPSSDWRESITERSSEAAK